MIKREIQYYAQSDQKVYNFKINFENPLANPPEVLAQLTIFEPLRVLITVLGVSPVSLDLGLFYRENFQYSSKRITKISLFMVLAFLVIVGRNIYAEYDEPYS